MRDATHDRLAYIEEVGLALESQGLPRMAGRVFGALLVADPPEQSADDLMETLQASRGSISQMTRLLEAGGLIERVSKPGERRVYYRNKPDAWYHATRSRAPQMTQMRCLAEKGLGVLGSDDPEVRRGLEDMLDFYRFMESEMPALLEHWYEHRRRRGFPDDPAAEDRA